MTSLYAHNFVLLPRPQRAVFSLGDESTRATLPDFADVEQLRSFVYRLHVWRFDVLASFIQIKFGAVFLGVLLAIILAIILRRMFDSSFWLLRVFRKPSGLVVVPNALLAFSAIEGIFAVVAITFLWLYCTWFEGRQHAPASPILWITMIWSPLYCGAVWAMWGTYFATPSSEQLGFGMRERSRLQTFFGHAFTINALGLLSPLVVTLSVIAPAYLCNRGYMVGLRMGQEWDAKYGGQATFTEDMVQDAQRVWFQAIASMYTGNIVFICWSFHAFALAAGYAVVSLRLLSFVRSELQMSADAPVRFVGIMTTHVFSKAEMDSQDEERGITLGQVMASGRRPLSSVCVTTHKVTHGQQLPGETTEDNEITVVNTVDSTGKAHTLSKLSHTLPSPVYADHRPAGWRRYMPNILQRNDDDDRSTAPRSKQMRDLRTAFVHIFIQFLAICPACVVLGIMALLMAVTMYGTTEQPSASGGNRFEYIFNIVALLCMYTVCAAGGVTLCAIAARTYEGVQFGSRGNVSSGGGGGGPSSASAEASGGDGNGGRSDDGGVRTPVQRKARLARIFGRTRPATSTVDHTTSTFFETHTYAGRSHIAPASRYCRSHSSQHALNETLAAAAAPTTSVFAVHYADTISSPLLPTLRSPPPVPPPQHNYTPDERVTAYSEACARRDERRAQRQSQLGSGHRVSSNAVLAPALFASVPSPPPQSRARLTRAPSESTASSGGGSVRPHPFNSGHRSGSSWPLTVWSTTGESGERRPA